MLHTRFCRAVVMLLAVTAASAEAFVVLPPPPTANAGPDRATNQPVLLDASVTGATVTTWTMISGPLTGLIAFLTPSLEDTVLSANVEGVYVVRLTAVNLGGVATDDVTITWDVTPPVMSSLSDLTVEAGDPTGAFVTYSPPTVSDNLTAVTVAYSQASGTVFPLGDTTVVVTATDAAGNQANRSFQVHVVDTSAPLIVSGISVVPSPIGVGQNLSLSCAASDASPLTFTWDFGDGTSVDAGSAIKHAYTAVGTYTINVTVKDSGGRTSTASASVTVQQDPVFIPPDPPPPGGGSGGGGGGVEGQPTASLPLAVGKISGSCRFDGKGDDTYSIKGSFDIAAGFNPSGATATVFFGGAKSSFILDGKGKGVTTGASFSLRCKKTVFTTGGTVAFQIKVKGPLQSNWADEGFVSGATINTADFNCDLSLLGLLFSTRAPVGCKVNPKTGIKFKN